MVPRTPPSIEIVAVSIQRTRVGGFYGVAFKQLIAMYAEAFAEA